MRKTFPKGMRCKDKNSVGSGSRSKGDSFFQNCLVHLAWSLQKSCHSSGEDNNENGTLVHRLTLCKPYQLDNEKWVDTHILSLEN